MDTLSSMSINPFFHRLGLLAGEGLVEALNTTKVLLFGLGGVGSWCAEALVRSGIGAIALVDFDRISASNINRQVQATSKTIGLPKAEILKARLLEINPHCAAEAFDIPFSRETAGEFDRENPDYIIDAIDVMPHKLDLIEYASGKPFFSSMGMARKLDPTQLKTCDIWETKGCPLARLVRSELRKRNFQGHFTAVYSAEQPPAGAGVTVTEKVTVTPAAEKGSAVTVTAAAGMILASLVLRDVYARITGAASEAVYG